ncbi:cation-translocating P-type ATPase [archaeon]|nr:MAG: cation-translocating P-type ATPase [archaeon]
MDHRCTEENCKSSSCAKHQELPPYSPNEHDLNHGERRLIGRNSSDDSDGNGCDHGQDRFSKKENVCVKLNCDDPFHDHTLREPLLDHGDDHSHGAGIIHGVQKLLGLGDHKHDHGHDDEDHRHRSHSGGDHRDHDHEHGHEHGHSHGHGHAHGHGGGCCGDDDDDAPCSYIPPSCCDHDHSNNHGHGHGHDHGHDHGHEGRSISRSHDHDHGRRQVSHEAKSCCEDKKLSVDHGVRQSSESSCCGTVHNRPHHIGSISVEYNVVVDIESQEPGIPLTNFATAPATVCSSCDPSSPILHAIQVTRLRVANMCCAGEERLIRTTLEKVNGVEHIAVSLVGKYVVIKHCPVPCCAPADRIVNMLNDLHLGVSLQDVGDNDAPEVTPIVNVVEAVHVTLVTILFIVGLGLYLSHLNDLHEKSAWVFVSSMAIGLVPIAHDALISVLRGVLDIHLLMLVAVAGAVGSKEYFDGSLVVTMFLVAEFIESVVVAKVQRAVTLSNSHSMPKKAYLSSGKSILVKELQIGDVLAIRAGELIVADGVVVSGEGVVNESALTGESAPVAKKISSAVFSGTVVQNGYIEVKIQKSVADSTMMQLSQAVADVQADRGEYAKMIDVFAFYWTPFVLLATILLVTIGGGVTGDWGDYTHRGLVLLVLACPCAVVISAPIPSICAIANAAQSGVLIRGSTVIERMSTIDAVSVDKTGTLTKATFSVLGRLLLHDALDYDPLALAAAVEAQSTHPLANAIVSAHCGCIAELAESSLASVKKMKVVDGVGLEAWVKHDNDWKFVCIGNERLLRSGGGKVHLTKEEESKVAEFKAAHMNKAILFVAVEDELVMALALADEVRPEAKSFVSSIHAMSMEVHMLTGDAEQVAQDICSELGIRHCHARLMPEQKLTLVEQLHKEGRKTLMIGDGINDSIALAAATVGVAMGAGGTAMAVAAADVVLLNDNLLLLPPAIKLCRLAKAIILQNFSFAIAIKIVAIVLAVIGLLEFWEAVLIDVGSLLVVVCNGTRPLRYQQKST